MVASMAPPDVRVDGATRCSPQWSQCVAAELRSRTTILRRHSCGETLNSTRPIGVPRGPPRAGVSRIHGRECPGATPRGDDDERHDAYRARTGGRRRRAELRSAGAEPDHGGGDRADVAGRGRCARHPCRGDRRARRGQARIGTAGQPGRAVGQTSGAAPVRFEAREAARARARVRCAGSCPHWFSPAARAATLGRLLRFLFGAGRCPSGPGSRASHRAPAMPDLGPFGLRSLSRTPRPTHTGSQVA